MSIVANRRIGGTSLSRRRSRVRVPSLPYKIPVNGPILLSRSTTRSGARAANDQNGTSAEPSSVPQRTSACPNRDVSPDPLDVVGWVRHSISGVSSSASSTARGERSRFVRCEASMLRPASSGRRPDDQPSVFPGGRPANEPSEMAPCRSQGSRERPMRAARCCSAFHGCIDLPFSSAAADRGTRGLNRRARPCWARRLPLVRCRTRGPAGSGARRRPWRRRVPRRRGGRCPSPG